MTPPWCTLFLVVSLTASNLCVFLGNRAVAKAISDLGDSASGWSKIALGVTQSLEVKVAVRLLQVSDSLAQGLHHLEPSQARLQGMLTLAGRFAEAVEATQSQAQTPGSALELQLEAEVLPPPLPLPDRVVTVKREVLKAVRETLHEVREEVVSLLGRLHRSVQPALETLGRWASDLGGDIQSGLSNFAATVDQVQGLLNEVLSQLRRRQSRDKDKESVLSAEVFDFFDSDHDGLVRLEELRSAAERYAIPELQGDFGRQLAAKHGSTSPEGRHALKAQQLQQLLGDPMVPLSAGQVLQRYARLLSEVSSQLTMAANRSSGDVARALVQYLSAISAKNSTKVSWVAERLGNGSLALEFTASVLSQLCVHEEDPERLDVGMGVDIGAWLLGLLTRRHATAARGAITLVGNTSFWTSQGFEAADQASCVDKLMQWRPAAAASLEPAQVVDQVPHVKVDVATPAAAAEMRRFALWLSYNTSATAQSYQDLVFDTVDTRVASSGAGISRVDTMGAQLQGLLGQLESLLGLMAEHASPEALSQLEWQLLGFANQSLAQLSLGVERHLQQLLDAAGSDVQRLEAEARRALELLGQAVGGERRARLERLLQEAMESFTGAEALLQSLASESAPHPATTSQDPQGLLDGLPDALGVLAEKLPLALTSLAAAQRETSKLRTVLSAAFLAFEARGPALFYAASGAWSTAWALYALLLLPVHLLVLCYSFWVQGQSRGQPASGQCCRHSALCLWPALLCLQAITALLFLAAVLLCAVLGLEAFAQQGCSQAYPLADETSCEEALSSLDSFIRGFSPMSGEIEEAEVPQNRCKEQALLTCQILGRRMMSATALTVFFGFVSAILSAQMLVDFAIHHERAHLSQRIREECSGSGEGTTHH